MHFKDIRVRNLVKYCSTFGIFPGIRMFLSLKFNAEATIFLPGILHPIHLRDNDSDIKVFHQVFVFGEYDTRFSIVPKVVIDGGANIGMFALWIKSKYPLAKVICVEPDTQNRDWLERNLSAYNDVEIRQAGIWGHDVRLRVLDKFKVGKWGLCVEEDEFGDVEGICMRSLFLDHDVQKADLVKLDIEGSEASVFAEDDLSWLSDVGVLMIELHDRISPGCSQTFFRAVDRVYDSYDYAISGENTVVRGR